MKCYRLLNNAIGNDIHEFIKRFCMQLDEAAGLVNSNKTAATVPTGTLEFSRNNCIFADEFGQIAPVYSICRS